MDGAAGGTAGAKRTVLVIDDSETVRGFLGAALRDRGFRVLEAEDGVIGLWVVEDRNSPVDLAILDVVMPMMDGPEFLRNARAFQPGLKVLYITGHDDRTLRDRGLDPCSLDLLRKPFDQDTLLARVDAALAE